MSVLKLIASSARWRCMELVLCLGVVVAPIGLSGCSGTAPTNAAVLSSPFIRFLLLDGFDRSSVTKLQYTVAPKPGSVSKPVHVEYSISALAARGYVGTNSLILPVFGLYAGYANQVSVELEGDVGGLIPRQFIIQTAEYVDPSGIYSQPNVVTPRAPGSTLGFDFMFIKSGLGSPVIVDTDGEIRWVAPGDFNSTANKERNPIEERQQAPKTTPRTTLWQPLFYYRVIICVECGNAADAQHSAGHAGHRRDIGGFTLDKLLNRLQN